MDESQTLSKSQFVNEVERQRQLRYEDNQVRKKVMHQNVIQNNASQIRNTASQHKNTASQSNLYPINNNSNNTNWSANQQNGQQQDILDQIQNEQKHRISRKTNNQSDARPTDPYHQMNPGPEHALQQFDRANQPIGNASLKRRIRKQQDIVDSDRQQLPQDDPFEREQHLNKMLQFLSKQGVQPVASTANQEPAARNQRNQYPPSQQQQQPQTSSNVPLNTDSYSGQQYPVMMNSQYLNPALTQINTQSSAQGQQDGAHHFTSNQPHMLQQACMPQINPELGQTSSRQPQQVNLGLHSDPTNQPGADTLLSKQSNRGIRPRQPGQEQPDESNAQGGSTQQNASFRESELKNIYQSTYDQNYGQSTSIRDEKSRKYRQLYGLDHELNQKLGQIDQEKYLERTMEYRRFLQFQMEEKKRLKEREEQLRKQEEERIRREMEEEVKRQKEILERQRQEELELLRQAEEAKMRRQMMEQNRLEEMQKQPISQPSEEQGPEVTYEQPKPVPKQEDEEERFQRELDDMKRQLTKEKKKALLRGDLYKEMIEQLKTEVVDAKVNLFDNQHQLQQLMISMHDEVIRGKEERQIAQKKIQTLQQQLVMNKVAEDKRIEELNRALIKTQPLQKNHQLKKINSQIEQIDTSHMIPELQSLVYFQDRSKGLVFDEPQNLFYNSSLIPANQLKYQYGPQSQGDDQGLLYKTPSTTALKLEENIQLECDELPSKQAEGQQAGVDINEINYKNEYRLNNLAYLEKQNGIYINPSDELNNALEMKDFY